MSKIKAVLDKYRQMSDPVKASFWFTVCNCLNKGISLFATPILTRIMSKEQYGMYSVYQSWLSIITILCTVNIYIGAYTTGLVHHEDDKNKMTSSMLGLVTVITLIWLCAFLFFQDYIVNLFGLPAYLILPMFFEVLFCAALEFWMAQQRFDYKYKKLVIISISMNFFSLLLGVVTVLISKNKAEARIYSDVFVKCLVGLAFYALLMRKGKQFVNLFYWKYALKFNFPLIPHFFSHFILGQSDRLMISSMVGTGYAAVYSVAYSVSMMMTLIINAICNSFTPYVYKKIKSGDVGGVARAGNVLFIFVGALCICASALAPEIIRLFASPEYSEAIWIVPPVTVSIFFIFIYSLYCNVEYYFNKTVGVSVASILSALTNLILNYLFIDKYGFLAAGYTTLISYILLSATHYMLYKRVVGEKLKESVELYDNRFVLKISIVVVIMMFAMLKVYNYTLIRYSIILILLIVGYIKRDKILEVLKKSKV